MQKSSSIRFTSSLITSAAAFLLGTGAVAEVPAPTPEELKNPPAQAERHASGLVSLKLEEGTGKRHPDPNDIAKVHFTGWTLDGAVFRTTRGDKPGSFPLDKVFPGWSEGIQLMVVGEKRRLWVPEHLGPPNARSGPKSAVFDVELLDILDLPEPPATLKKPDPTAERLPSGTFTKQIEPGDGGKTPGPTGRVLLHYTLWNEQGTTLDSTFNRNRPTAFLLDRVMPAFSEAVQTMTLGESRYLWIPQFAHQGQWPNGPKGMMIFEIKLVRILPESVLQPQEGGGE